MLGRLYVWKIGIFLKLVEEHSYISLKIMMKMLMKTAVPLIMMIMIMRMISGIAGQTI